MRNFITAILIFSSLATWSQRTTRQQLKLNVAPIASERTDTIAEPSVSLSGYEKTLRSSKESILVTNACADTIDAISLTIDYLDMQGRQIHRRTLELSSPDPIAPGQTRQLEFRSWDSQRVWHYRLSQPTNPTGQATPYDIKATINYALRKR